MQFIHAGIGFINTDHVDCIYIRKPADSSNRQIVWKFANNDSGEFVEAYTEERWHYITSRLA